MTTQRCSRCLYPLTTRPSITFDEEGICSGCRTDEKKAVIDWAGRLEKLKELVEPYKGRGDYDCIIGVSGGKDSTFQNKIHLAMSAKGFIDDKDEPAAK